MPIRHRSIAAAFLAAGVAACSGDSTAPKGAGPMSVSFSTAAAVGAPAASRGTIQTSIAAATTAPDSLVITSAQLVLARVELQRVGAACGASGEVAGDDAGDQSNACAELELAPSVVDLPVGATVASALDVTVPAGTYSAFEAKIRPVASDGHGHGSSAFLAAHPDLANVSVRVQGTFNGRAFTYLGAPHAQLESVFSPALTIDATHTNVTVQVDLSTWFRTASGTLIDPATANAGGASAQTVSDNIRRSFRAFRDDDRNGHDDHEDGAHHG